MNNRSTICMTTLRGKTRSFGPIGPASALLSLNTIPLPRYGTAGQRFHTTAPMTSSENDIDILNTTPTSSAACPNGIRRLHRVIAVALHR